jgi:hypothetical protein
VQAHRPKTENKLSPVLKCVGYASLALSILSSSLLHAGQTERDEARRMHERLTGVPPTNTVLTTMEGLIASNPEDAAIEAMKNPAFYNVTLKNYVAPWTNEAQSVFVPLNDYSATVIGLIRDNVDFRAILHGNILYTGNVSGIAAYSNANNDHYEQLEQKGPIDGNLADDTILVKKTQTEVTGLPDEATAGVITTRAAAAAFFSAGTNRAMFRFTMMNHMCTDVDPLKDVSRVPDRVRQDVSRSPGGDSRIYMFNCVGCHAGMDGLSGAFARYEYNEAAEEMEYTANAIAAKYLINSDNFKHGYVTTDDSWVNYWRNGQNKLLGWADKSSADLSSAGITFDDKDHAHGNGAKSFGHELANSYSFARCQVKKAYQAVCLHNPDDYAADRELIDGINGVGGITRSFMTDYNMKNVFAKVAASCR